MISAFDTTLKVPRLLKLPSTLFIYSFSKYLFTAIPSPISRKLLSRNYSQDRSDHHDHQSCQIHPRVQAPPHSYLQTLLTIAPLGSSSQRHAGQQPSPMPAANSPFTPKQPTPSKATPKRTRSAPSTSNPAKPRSSRTT